MTSTLALLLGLAFLAVNFFVVMWAMQPEPEPYNREHDPRYHGADALNIGWKGEITAFRWEKGRYIVMWRRG